MSTNKFTDAFKRDAVARVVDRGYSVREVAERLGVRCPASECEAIAERENQVDLLCAASIDIAVGDVTLWRDGATTAIRIAQIVRAIGERA